MMPVKIWDQDQSGHLASSIRWMGQSGIDAEEHRPQAESLDEQIDLLLDNALALLDQQDQDQKHSLFAARWALGRAIADSDILASLDLDKNERSDLLLAMARKCRLGVRHTGQIAPTPKWNGLLPTNNRDNEPKRIEADIFGLGMWLQEQQLEDAKMAFGGGLHNAKQIWSGEALRSPKLRQALTTYFAGFSYDEKEIIYRIPQYAKLAKALRQRWPSRGKGSAKRPVHYEQDELSVEVSQLLDPITTEILSEV